MAKEIEKTKVDKKDVEWFRPTLLNGADQIEHYEVEYHVDALGYIHFRGRLVTSGLGNITAFVLPIDYRPSKQQIFLLGTSSNASFQRVAMANSTTGLYVYQNSLNYIDLSSMTYLTRSAEDV